MSLQKLAAKVTRREGKRSIMKMGDCEEALAIVQQLEAEHMYKERLKPTGNTKSPLDVLKKGAFRKFEHMVRADEQKRAPTAKGAKRR